jgi:protocatechuate 3,4-dioxygenase beta subunit
MKKIVQSISLIVLIFAVFSVGSADDTQAVLSGHVYSTPPMLPAFIPLAGANVYLNGNGITLQVTSNPEGFYQFNDVKPGEYLLSADASGHLPAYHIDTIVVKQDTQISDLDIFLTPYDGLGFVTLSGNVWGKYTDELIHPATITLFPVLSTAADNSILMDSWGISVINNPDGSYVIKNIPRGIYNVSCNARGYDSQLLKNVNLTSGDVTLNFFLEPLDPSITNLFAGMVYNGQTNQPVPYAVLTLNNLDGPEIIYYARSDINGYYQFKSILPGNYELTCNARGFHSFTTIITITQHTWITDFNISLKPINDILVTLYGYVLDAGSDIKPIYPAQIMLFGYSSSGEIIVYRTQNNPDGSYKIGNILPSTYMALCYVPGYQTKIIRQLPVYEPLSRFDFYLSPMIHKWGYIAGNVQFDRLGTPVHGADIKFFSENAAYHHTVTDRNGNYIARLPAGKYYVSCSYHDPDGNYYYKEYYDDVQSLGEATVVTVRPNEITSHIDFGIPFPLYQFTVTISGCVLDNNNMPLKEALVKAWQINVPFFNCEKDIYFAWTDKEGKFKIEINLDISNSTRPTPLYGFIVSAEKERYKTEFYNEKPAPYLADILWAFQDTTFTNVDFSLDPWNAPNSISGIITSETGDAIANAFVIAFNKNSGETIFTFTNNLGQYTLDALQPDYYYLLFMAQGYMPEFFDDKHVWEDATPVLAIGTVNGIDANLMPIFWDTVGGTVAGTVCTPNGQPLSGVLVAIKNSTGDIVGYDLTNEQGSYQISGLGDGDYQSFATKVNYGSQSSPICINSATTEMILVNFELEQMVTNLPGPGIEEVSIPTKITLMPNYPNPFNPVTRIQFANPSTQKVRLIIYDILGKKVKELVHQVLPSGWYTFIWDATDNMGNQVSSGIYFYALETREERIVNKLIFNK